ncbi:hypothetical protein SAMN04515647_3551 [Cohaesibacter sp. ES.047]|nr:hypothetical protein SAMN04515647_3551 [Cohaesibacter sp. ES.047]
MVCLAPGPLQYHASEIPACMTLLYETIGIRFCSLSTKQQPKPTLRPGLFKKKLTE